MYVSSCLFMHHLNGQLIYPPWLPGVTEAGCFSLVGDSLVLLISSMFFFININAYLLRFRFTLRIPFHMYSHTSISFGFKLWACFQKENVHISASLSRLNCRASRFIRATWHHFTWSQTEPNFHTKFKILQ